LFVLKIIVTFSNHCKTIDLIAVKKYVTRTIPSNMKVTKADNQSISLKNKVAVFFTKSIANKKKKSFCIVKDAMSVVTDKWSLFVIYNLGYYEALRFTELKSNIRSISSRMLSVTLKKLEANQIIKRKVYAEVPPRVEYELTAFGKLLAEKTIDINQWYLDLVISNQVKPKAVD